MAIYQTDEELQRQLERELLEQELQKTPGTKPAAVQTSGWAYTPPPPTGDLSQYGSTGGVGRSVASGAATGASLGTVIPGVGNLVGGAIGAAAGGIYGLVTGRRNDAKNQREDFAKQLGVADTTALWNKLESELPPEQAYELKNRALNRIGKKDIGANQQWMADVQAALQDAPRSRAAWEASQSAAPDAAPQPGQAAATPTAYDSSQWDTDGYVAPGYVPESYGNAPAGWDAGKWGNANHQTPKYAVGRILNQYAPSIENASKAAEEISKAYPGATFNGKDKITIPGVGTIDVLTNSGSGQNMGWAWQPLDASAPGSSAPVSSTGPASSDPSAFSRVQSLVPMDSDFFNRLQAQLTQILGGSQAFERDALLRLLSNNQ